MGYWTLEGEFVWHYRTDWDIGAATYSIGTVTNVFSNVESRSLLVNLIRRGPISPYWSWEVGAGIGLVKHKVESEYLERPIPGIRPQQSFKASSSESGFGYNVLAGITRDLGGAWTLNMRYRFIDLGEMQAGPFPMRPAKVTTDATAQEIQFSLEREF
jgi:opacity protein-like surface antigen